MVTLGLTALTPVVLGAQFIALKRIGAIQKQIADLHKKFDAAMVADLETGIDLLAQGQSFLGQGDQSNAHSRLNDAVPLCHRTMKYYAKLLGDNLQQAKVNRDGIRLLTRHLSVAIAGVASCQIGLKQDQHAFDQSKQEIDLLRQAARRVFHELVARDPAPYLLPPMRENGVTIDYMASCSSRRETLGHWIGARTRQPRPSLRTTVMPLSGPRTRSQC